jgi:hypothetical protein
MNFSYNLPTFSFSFSFNYFFLILKLLLPLLLLLSILEILLKLIKINFTFINFKKWKKTFLLLALVLLSHLILFHPIKVDHFHLK